MTDVQTKPAAVDSSKEDRTRTEISASPQTEAGSDSGPNQTNQAAPTTNGVSVSPTKKIPSKSREAEKRATAPSPVKSPSKSVKSLPRTPEAGPPSTTDKKKVPMNKVQVGAAPSPNLKTVRSKIGSLDNASYKPGGGKVKIENRKLDFSKAQPKIAAKNDKYTPSGGDKKQITQVKLQWNAKPKVGSLDNATYKPGGGDKKIETVKLDFKDKAKPKVGSKDNAKHVPGGGTVKIKSPSVAERPSFIETTNSSPPEPNPPPTTPTRSRPSSAISPVTPRALRTSLQAKTPDSPSPKRVTIAEEPRAATNDAPSSARRSPIADGRQSNETPSSARRSPIADGRQSNETLSSARRSPIADGRQSNETPSSARKSPIADGRQSNETPSSARKSPIADGRQSNETPSSARRSPISDGLQTPRRARTPRSPGSSRPPSSLNIRTPDKSPNSSRKNSPKGVHLPRLTSTPSPIDSDENTPSREASKVKLPKLMQTSMLSNRVELAQ